MNRVRRRFRAAVEIRSRVLWLSRTPVARIAWMLKDVSDAGWTVDHIEAWLLQREGASRIQRPSAFLAARMVGATVIWPTEAQRNRAYEATRERVSANARLRGKVHDESMSAPDSQRLGCDVLASLRRGQVAQSVRARALGLDDRSGLFSMPVSATELDDEAAVSARFAAFLEGGEL